MRVMCRGEGSREPQACPYLRLRLLHTRRRCWKRNFMGQEHDQAQGLRATIETHPTHIERNLRSGTILCSPHQVVGGGCSTRQGAKQTFASILLCLGCGQVEISEAAPTATSSRHGWCMPVSSRTPVLAQKTPHAGPCRMLACAVVAPVPTLSTSRFDTHRCTAHINMQDSLVSVTAVTELTLYLAPHSKTT